MSAAYVDIDRETRAGGVILAAAAFLSAFLVLAGLIYATGTNGRHRAAVAAADCEPSLFISGLPCTTQQMIASQYEAVVTPATQALTADMAAYRASERHSLAAAEAALTGEVGTEQALGNNLAAMMFTPQNRAKDVALITTAADDSNPFPTAAITFTPQVTAIAGALIQAIQALAKLTAEQARSSTLTQMRSFNHRVQVARAAVQTEMTLVRQAADKPLPS